MVAVHIIVASRVDYLGILFVCLPLETIARPEMAPCMLGKRVDNQVFICRAPFSAAASLFPQGQFMVWVSACEAVDGAEPVQQEAFSLSGSSSLTGKAFQ